MKQTAQEKLISIITTCGYSEEDAIYLLSQYLEEEAPLYVECMCSLDEYKEERLKRMS